MKGGTLEVENDTFQIYSEVNTEQEPLVSQTLYKKILYLCI